MKSYLDQETRFEALNGTLPPRDTLFSQHSVSVGADRGGDHSRVVAKVSEKSATGEIIGRARIFGIEKGKGNL